jgi:hypothetical protein
MLESDGNVSEARGRVVFRQHCMKPAIFHHLNDIKSRSSACVVRPSFLDDLEYAGVQVSIMIGTRIHSRIREL